MVPHIEYRNPYDFVPLEEQPTYLPSTLSDLDKYTGWIEFQLHVLSPICIHQDPSRPDANRQYLFAHLGNTPIIPATSIKGMLRTVHEVVTNSTLGMLKREQRGGWYRNNLPANYLPGMQRGMTASELLFGTVGDESDTSVGQAGRMLLDDVVLRGPLELMDIWRPRGGQPKPEHRSFYFDPADQLLGRKFYYHQQNYQSVLDFYGQIRRRASEQLALQVVPGGIISGGRLRFIELSKPVLAGLIYALVLEDGLAHKLGYGKPLGLGSLRLEITRFEVEGTTNGIPDRLLAYGTSSTTSCLSDVPELQNTARVAWQARAGGAASYAAFTAIAQWPQRENFVYPDYSFFMQERNGFPKTPIWTYQRRSSHFAGGGMARPSQLPDLGPAPLIAPPPTQPVVPQPPVDTRLIALVQYSPSQGVYVIGHDNKKYRLVKESAPSVVLQRLLSQLEHGAAPQIRYHGDRQKQDTGNWLNIALDVELVEEET